MSIKHKTLRFFKVLFKSILIFLGVVVFYVLMVWLLPKIESGSEIITEKRSVEIFIKSNGVHTDLVVPVCSKQINWSTYFDYKNTKSQDTAFRYVALGWGDKGFYLETPKWSELKFSTAFKAAFALSSAAVHATYYNEMHLSETCKSIKISVKQYKRLIAYVKRSVILKENKFKFISTKAIYGDNDAFYDANGSYSIFHSCNSWVNVCLKEIGQTACFWTVTSSPMFEKY